MASRVRKPETHKIDISLGDWLLVKKHLTAGEKRQMLRGMYVAGAEPGMPDTTRYGLCRIMTYLLDWSFTDADGNQLVIRDQPADVVEAALSAIDPESFTEVLDAIDAHDAAMQKARVAEKNVQAGESGSSAISTSPDSSAGVTNG